MEYKSIFEFQQRLVKEYNASLGLSSEYRFINGVPVLPVPALDLARNGVMILGAYPTALFARIGAERDVPVGNISRPFADDSYFDGQSERRVEAGKELTEHYLQPLHLNRSQCWITNLVRVFLFKPGHIEKYRRLGFEALPLEMRGRFEDLAASEANREWLYEELQIAKPRVVVTLGAEVAGILQNEKSPDVRRKLLNGSLQEFQLGGNAYPCIHLAHPGIVMRPPTRYNPWPLWNAQHCKVACTELDQLLKRRR